MGIGDTDTSPGLKFGWFRDLTLPQVGVGVREHGSGLQMYTVCLCVQGSECAPSSIGSA